MMLKRKGQFERKRYRPKQDAGSFLSYQLSVLRRSKERRAFLFWVVGLAVAIYLLTSCVITAAVIHGDAMAPSLYEGDFALLWKVGKQYLPGDIVFFRSEATSGIQVRRVIAGPGDEVEIDDEAGLVLVNGVSLTEPYAPGGTYSADVEYPLVLGENEYFLLGDNRAGSMDSRFSPMGVVTKKQIVGRLIFLARSLG